VGQSDRCEGMTLGEHDSPENSRGADWLLRLGGHVAGRQHLTWFRVMQPWKVAETEREQFTQLRNRTSTIVVATGATEAMSHVRRRRNELLKGQRQPGRRWGYLPAVIAKSTSWAWNAMPATGFNDTSMNIRIGKLSLSIITRGLRHFESAFGLAIALCLRGEKNQCK